ncbi:MAG: 16S rRNA (cytidine(1402)-2'-O)-methyltransferase [Crocinitomicaceae bacterium]
MSKLYLVPTPIGNLEDITLRSIRILKECDIIFAEDTRVTKRLLQHLEIQKPLQPFHAHNEHKSLKSAVDRIASVGSAVLVSDAGTPGISDPGFLLIRECIKEGVPVDCLPGPTAFVPAVVASGFPCDKFIYEGFLPHKKGRQTLLKNIAERDITTIVYESPHRLLKCLAQIEEFMGSEREICVARELTKMYEEFQRGPVSKVKAHYDAHPPKGEIVVVISGKSK